MPKVVKMYKGSRSNLKHNLGGWFEKKEPEPKPEPPPEPPKDEWTEKTKAGIAARREALKEIEATIEGKKK